MTATVTAITDASGAELVHGLAESPETIGAIAPTGLTEHTSGFVISDQTIPLVAGAA